ncbi:tagatose-6-phosphate ketose/aldose isomerase [Enterococcus sp. DIV0755b]|uniref:SIS domain-containing protein n=1 Tax=Enterococcus sp. DIV0755b TaxID=2774657 RepID=UPI003F299287
MFQFSTEELTKMGAEITTREIKQQPELWQEAFSYYKENIERINAFLTEVKKAAVGKVRIVFTGAGTSQYVGDTIKPYLNKVGDSRHFIFESIGTTDIVASPAEYLHPDDWTILVSFARSGNSPESVAAVDVANKYVKNLRHITITCAPEGQLAKAASGDEHNLLLMMPAHANDQGFAMTGSFSCMALTALLLFDEKNDLAIKETYVKSMATLGNEAIAREDEVQKIVDLDFDRIVYLGSGSLAGLTREASLKVLELTAGKMATVFDSSMGFRHGPKSFINEKTIVFVFVNNDDYTRQYDVDILEEVYADKIAPSVLGISQKNSENNFSGANFVFNSSEEKLPDGYAALPFLMVAQTVSLLSSIKVGNTPDTPSPTGTVNRVVKGVTIHPFEA